MASKDTDPTSLLAMGRRKSSTIGKFIVCDLDVGVQVHGQCGLV